MRLVEQAVSPDDPDPNAPACSEVLVRCADPATGASEAAWLCFIDGRPVSAVTVQFLGWRCNRLTAMGAATLVVIRDNAAWHISHAVRRWIRAHNARAYRAGGGRVILCILPIKSPWLNPNEPKQIHGKRRIVEPVRLLTGRKGEEGVGAVFACPHVDHLAHS
jgi:hypothetical protein